MSEAQGDVEYQVKKAKSKEDPPAAWISGVLNVYVQPEETAAIELKHSEKEFCVKLSESKGKALETVIGRYKRELAGAKKFTKLKLRKELPVPSDLQETELITPAKSTQVGASVSPQLSARGLQAAIVAAHCRGGKRHICLTEEEIRAELNNDDEHLPVQLRLEDTIRRALQRKLKLLFESGLIRDTKEEFGPSFLLPLGISNKNFSYQACTRAVSESVGDWSEKETAVVNQESTEISRRLEFSEFEDSSAGEEEAAVDTEDEEEMADPSPAVMAEMEAAEDALNTLTLKVQEHTKNALKLHEVEHWLGSAKDLKLELKDVYLKVLSTANLKKEVDTQARTKMKESRAECDTVIVKLLEIKEELTEEKKKESGDRRSSGSGGGGGGPSLNQLPKLKLPKFDGSNWKSWLSYKDYMQDAVFSRDDISPVIKFHYLKDSLEGEAKLLINNIEGKGYNFDRAWEALLNRYNNTRRLVNQYLSDLDDIRPMTRPSAKELRKIHDRMTTNREALRTLEVPVDECDILLVNRLVRCFDGETRNWYEMGMALGGDTNEMTWDKLTEFVNARCQAWESHLSEPGRHDRRQSHEKKTTAMHVQSSPCSCSCSGSSGSREQGGKSKPAYKSTPKCVWCSKEHWLTSCEEYKQATVEKRRELVQQKHLCFNCLRGGHSARECKQKSACQHCGKKHHTTLHTPGREESPAQDAPTVSHHVAEHSSSMLLPTARVLVTDRNEEKQPLRALLDTGSESNFITESAVQMLRLKKRHAQVPITGISAEDAGSTSGIVELQLTSTVDSSWTIKISALVLSRITTDIGQQVSPATWKKVRKLPLADPDFNKPGKIDLLLGADVVMRCMSQAAVESPSQPVAHQTKLGWILGGNVEFPRSRTRLKVHTVRMDDKIAAQLQQFWGVEHLSVGEESPQEETCEKLFAATTTRAADGKLVVKMPFKSDPPDIGQSKEIALRRLQGCEARLSRRIELHQEYSGFMEDYEKQGHMEEVMEPVGQANYLPHHPIIRTTALTTKLQSQDFKREVTQ